MKIIGLAGVVFVLVAAIGLLSGASRGLSAQSAPAFVVTKTADTNDGRCDRDCSLREAIIEANGKPGNDWVHVKAGTYTLTITIAGPNEDESQTGDLDITDDATVSGDGPTKTIINANELDRVLDIPEGVSAVIRGMTMTEGHIHYDYGSLGWEDGEHHLKLPGGGIQNHGAVLLFRVDVTNNAMSAELGTGGGIYTPFRRLVWLYQVGVAASHYQAQPFRPQVKTLHAGAPGGL